MKDPRLTYTQWGTVISRFEWSTYIMEKTGDYPEKEEDKTILEQLIHFQYEEMKRERSKSDA